MPGRGTNKLTSPEGRGTQLDKDGDGTALVVRTIVGRWTLVRLPAGLGCLVLRSIRSDRRVPQIAIDWDNPDSASDDSEQVRDNSLQAEHDVKNKHGESTHAGVHSTDVKPKQRTFEPEMIFVWGKIRVPIMQTVEIFAWTSFNVQFVVHGESWQLDGIATPEPIVQYERSAMEGTRVMGGNSDFTIETSDPAPDSNPLDFSP